MRDSLAVASRHLPDEGLARRIKSMACTAPLLALDDNKASLGFGPAKDYQLAEIALHTIDHVTVSMDFDSGADHKDILAGVAPFVAVQRPDRTTEEHERIATLVLQRLLNIGTADRSFGRDYGLIDGEGGYRLHHFPFRLLVERPFKGKTYVRATDEAINVLVGALDTDVESAQVAAEVKLEHLIRRKRLSEAKLAAEQARYRTVQYGETIRRHFDATRRDVRTVDWEHEVPKLLAEALDHVQARYRAEHSILRNISQARDASEDPTHKQQAAELVDIVRDCIRRHMRLQKWLLEAGDLFRSEQDRQQFADLPVRETVDLHGQLLRPLLSLTVRDALPAATVYFRSATAPQVPAVTSLATLVPRLLLPPRERERLGGSVPEPELETPEPMETFGVEEWRITDELLSFEGGPRRLGELLTRALAHGPAVAALLAHRVAHAFSPPVGEHLDQVDDRMLVSVRAEALLDTPLIGGDDLLVGTVPLLPAPRTGEETDTPPEETPE
ncbi:hypothetical protein GCM10010232_15830 [Streptomyces amakusaensis]|uniref:Uncharacterized protein n=1 Tax=Streptomyces amakusaensis TaxID=67271 RepID=A0ABW0AKV3_9ACTN